MFAIGQLKSSTGSIVQTGLPRSMGGKFNISKERIWMNKKSAKKTIAATDQFFVKELSGEEAPTFVDLERLYELAGAFFSLRPWNIVDESELIATHDSVSGEVWYCSVMGSLGEVFALHAYRGDEGLQLFNQIANKEILEPAEILGSMNCLCAGVVSRTELEKQDRALLTALGHPARRDALAPIFRSIRPGFQPWYPNAEEVRILTDCLIASLVVCGQLEKEEDLDLWDEEGVYPLVKQNRDIEGHYMIVRFKPNLASESDAAIELPEELLQQLRGRDFALHGKLELAYIHTGASIGKANQRGRSASVALAVDAESGLILATEMTDSSEPSEVVLAKTLLSAVNNTGILPQEVYVRSARQKAVLTTLMHSHDTKIIVAKSLPTVEQVSSLLLEHLSAL